MATRRMFSRTVIENDNFIDMPATAKGVKNEQRTTS